MINTLKQKLKLGWDAARRPMLRLVLRLFFSDLRCDLILEIRRTIGNLRVIVEEGGSETEIGLEYLKFVMANLYELSFLDSTCQPERAWLEKWIQAHQPLSQLCLRSENPSDQTSRQPNQK